MTIPNFTADASLYKTNRHYRLVSGRRFEDAKLLPATIVTQPTPTYEKLLPPLKIGDLNCPIVTKQDWVNCNAFCAENTPDVPCASICSYRKCPSENMLNPMNLL